MTKHVMVVDDDPMIRFLVQEYLQALGFTVEAYGAGKDALEALAVRAPDLVVLDMQMPEMNGVEVLQKIRAAPHTSDVAVLLLSANASEAQAQAEQNTTDGADNYLEKPFQMQALLEAVQNTARASRPTP